MPPPQVTCSVCGETVMKAQTLAVGKAPDGTALRACRSHEATTSQAEQLQADTAAQKAKQEAAKRRAEVKRERPMELFDPKHMEFLQWADSHCWCCQAKGVDQGVYAQLRLTAGEICKIKGYRIFSQEEKDVVLGLFKSIGFEKPVVLYKFPLADADREKFKEWKGRFKPELQQIVEFGNIIQLCQDCQERTGIKFEHKMPSLENLALLGSVYEGSDMQKDTKNVAQALVDSGVL